MCTAAGEMDNVTPDAALESRDPIMTSSTTGARDRPPAPPMPAQATGVDAVSTSSSSITGRPSIHNTAGRSATLARLQRQSIVFTARRYTLYAVYCMLYTHNFISVRGEKNPNTCLLYTSPSPRDRTRSRMPSSA